MKNWNFTVKSNPQEIIKKLDESVDGFAWNIDQGKNDLVKFEMRKRIHYPHQILHRNRIVVNGKLKSDVDNITDVEISFAQHFLTNLMIINVFGLGLLGTIWGINSGVSIYILGVLIILIGTIFWMAVRKKFEKDIQKYKILISEVLEFEIA